MARERKRRKQLELRPRWWEAGRAGRPRRPGSGVAHRRRAQFARRRLRLHLRWAALHFDGTDDACGSGRRRVAHRRGTLARRGPRSSSRLAFVAVDPRLAWRDVSGPCRRAPPVARVESIRNSCPGLRPIVRDLASRAGHRRKIEGAACSGFRSALFMKMDGARAEALEAAGAAAADMGWEAGRGWAAEATRQRSGASAARAIRAAIAGACDGADGARGGAVAADERCGGSAARVRRGREEGRLRNLSVLGAGKSHPPGVRGREHREAEPRRTGWSIRVARGLNDRLRRSGKVFADRYHSVLLTTPRQVRHALCYVMQNARRHGEEPDPRWGGIDPFTSAWFFDGWADDSWRAAVAPATGPPPVTGASTWLLTTAWRRHRLIGTRERPAAARS
jgi:hypothetical protein